MYYLFHDTEGGGTNPAIHTLLTAYFGIYDRDLNLIDDLYLQLKPEDLSKINVTKEALDITGINLQEHLDDPNTVLYSEGRVKLLAFLEKHKIKGKRRSYRPAGHNVITYDIPIINNQLMPEEEWGKLVHYNALDTLQFSTILKECDLMPKDLGNLESFVKYFNIPMGQKHHAKEDTRMNVEVWKCMRDILLGKAKEFTEISNNSLLKIIEG